MITEELLQSIYDRTNQYCIAKYGKQPDYIIIDGPSIIARFENYYHRDRDYNDEYISPESLTDDLDELVKQRKEKERREEEIRKETREREEKLRLIREKEGRQRMYLQLKKEFEND